MGALAGAALVLAAGAVANAADAPSAPKDAQAGPLTREDLSGYWVVTNFHLFNEPLELRITKTVEGEPAPLRP